MNSNEICEVLRPRVRCFIGVFAADETIKIVTKISAKFRKSQNLPVSFIMNTDPSIKRGAHWVAFYIPSLALLLKCTPIELFDGFGHDDNPLHFKHTGYFKKFKSLLMNMIIFDHKVCPLIKRNSYNVIRLQGLDSNICGYYACLYIYSRCCRYIDMERFVQYLKNFGTQYRQRDNRVIEMFVHYLWRNRVGEPPHQLQTLSVSPISRYQNSKSMREC